MSIELSADEVVALIERVGFRIDKVRPRAGSPSHPANAAGLCQRAAVSTTYAANPLSNLQSTYQARLLVARKM